MSLSPEQNGPDAGAPPVVPGEVAPADAAVAPAAPDTAEAVQVWNGAFAVASTLGRPAMSAFARAQEALASEGGVDYDPETGLEIRTPVSVAARALAPSTAIVQVHKTEKSWRNPLSFLPDSVTEDKEHAVFGWTVAEVSSAPRFGGSTESAQADGDTEDDLLGELGAPVAVSGESDEDDALIDWDYRDDAFVDRVVVTNGTRHQLLRISGPRSAFDASGALTRIPQIPKREGDKDKARDIVEEYVKRNDFATGVKAEVITPEKIEQGVLDFDDPVQMGHLVLDGLDKLLRTTRASR